MKIINVVAHDPQWQYLFESEAEFVADALGENVVAIHHIGSTSIPGIYAKPVIDMLVEVSDLSEVEAKSAGMKSLGYQVMGEFGIAGRRYFRKDNEEGIRTHQIHIFKTGSEAANRHLAFRDYLIAHPAEAQEYSQLKRRLADEHSDDMNKYMDGKDPFIKEVERRAVLWLKG